MEVNLYKELFFLERLINHVIYVSVNTKCIGLVVPEWLYASDGQILEFGYGLAKPMQNLEVTKDGIRCTLSFRSSPFTVQVPWGAVFQMCTKDGTDCRIWPSDAPTRKVDDTPAPPSEEPEPTTVEELMAHQPVKDNVRHVDFRSRRDDSERHPA